jgi:hypothetical protein
VSDGELPGPPEYDDSDFDEPLPPLPDPWRDKDDPPEGDGWHRLVFWAGVGLMVLAAVAAAAVWWFRR